MFKVRRKDCKKGEVLVPFPANCFVKKIGLKIIFLYTAEAVTWRCSVKKMFLEFTEKFTGKHLRQSLFKVSVKLLALLKKILWRRCFPVNFTKFLRTPFLIEHLRWLLLTLKLSKIVFSSMGSPNLQV